MERLDGAGIGERAPWGDFPPVIRNGDLGELKQHAEYDAAKRGNSAAALALVDKLLRHETIVALRGMIGSEPVRLLPVLALEDSGHNKIPLAMAMTLADRLGLEVETGIVQIDKIMRTGAGAHHRLAFNPRFEGKVLAGQRYIILDDTLTMGGTIASLRGYVENRGGKVSGAAVMTAHARSVDIGIKPAMLAAIQSKHGSTMDTFWKETFGYGIDQLTQGEAGHLRAAASVDAIRARIAAARHGGVERVDAGRAATPPESGRAAEVGFTKTKQGALNDAAAENQREQQALLAAASIEQTWQEALAGQVQAKHAQVERIENRLEELIERKQAGLQRLENNAPGRLAWPSTRKIWQREVALQQARLQTLHGRLEAVREIKDGMGLHSPRVEELATRKLRALRPDMASSWRAMREEGRRQQLCGREDETDGARVTKGRGRSNKLS